MKKIGKDRGEAEVLFLLLLFGIFVLSALSVVLVGTKAYKKVQANMEENYTRRTGIAYVTEKIRQYDSENRISLKKIEGKDVLVLKKEGKGNFYVTYLYEEKHYLKELFLKEGQIPDFAYGQKILKIGGLSLTEEAHQIYRLVLEDENGQKTQVYLHPKTEGQEEKS